MLVFNMRNKFLNFYFITGLASLLALVTTSLSAYSAIYNQSVAEVDKHIVTSREVDMNILIDQTLFPRNKKIKLPMNFKSRRYLIEVNRVLIEWVVYLEGQDFSIVHVNKNEVQKSKKYLRKKLFKQRAWKNLGVSTNEFNQLLKRKLIAKKFIQFKVNSTATPITDYEAKEYYKNNKNKFGKLSYKQIKDNIKKFLKKTQLDSRLKSWFLVLQNKYDVKNHISIRKK